MDKTTFFNIVDIDSAEDFQYYENLAAIMEADDYIESNLLKDLFKNIDFNILSDCIDNYFEEFLKSIPDEETELYITIDAVKRSFLGMITEDPTSDEIAVLADEIVRFRKWYIHDTLVVNRDNGTELNVRDARYDIQACRLLGESYDYDFHLAYDYQVEGYNVKLADILEEY